MDINQIIYKEEYYGETHDNSIRCAGFLNTKTDKYEGEHISFYPNGKVHYRGFKVNNCWVGNLNIHGVSDGDFNHCYYSFIELGIPELSVIKSIKNIYRSPKSINEQEYKRELVRIRLGLIKIPQLSWKLKDFHLYSMETGCGKKVPNYVWG
jgi:hypothetical protein